MDDYSDDESNIDSETGGLSSGEEFEFNRNVDKESTHEAEERWVKM